MKRNIRIWWLLVINSFRTQVSTSMASIFYLVGKSLRFGFFLAYLLAIFQHVPALQGYDLPSVVLFFMTFNLIDVGGQFLFRGLYGIKPLIEEGDFDKILTQPANILFRICSMGTDMLDLLTLIPILSVTGWTLTKLATPPSGIQLAAYLFLLANGILLSFAFHVIIGGFSVLTQEFESAIWVYRDVMTLGRFPISVYSEAFRWLLVTVAPIGVMISYPVEGLLGLLSWGGILYATILGISFYVLARQFWSYALREYTSNSV